MPDLPGASPEVDKKMMEEIFTTSKFNFDYLKIYPCLDVKYTEIRKWKESGKWKPYSEVNGVKELVDLILHTKKMLIPKWIRVNRIQRDFPHEHVNNGHIGFQSDTHKSNLRQLIDDRMKKDGVRCKCIRCREIKNSTYEKRDVAMNCITYEASDGIEKFISYDDDKNDKILGFIRLRFPGAGSSDQHFIPALNGCALIRELHVYGSLKKVNDQGEMKIPQHNGFGKQLLRTAELLAYYNTYRKVAVISGTGVRNYYKKQGYIFEDTYMIKQLTFYKMVINALMLFLGVLGFRF
jgi:elongator complex protein 3